MKKLLVFLGFSKESKTVPEDGMKAYDQGFKFTDNPFREHTPQHSIWRDDWLFSAGKF